jgi:hypothetical protein
VTTTTRTSRLTAGETAEPWSIFEQGWWMDAVAPDAWCDVVVRDDAGVAGRLITPIRRRAGLRTSAPPPVTPHQGPWLRPVDGAPAHRLARQMEVLDALLEQLPPLALHRTRLSPGTPSCLPWHWRGYRLHLRYTYEIPAGRDEEAAWGLLRQRPRRAIRRAEERLGFRPAGVTEVEDLVNAGLTRTGAAELTDGLLSRLDAALTVRGRRDAIAATDAQGDAVAVAYFVHDDDATYYLLGGRRDDVRDDGAPSALIWRGMALARDRGVRFDFEGSMLRPIEAFFRSFGAQPVPYVDAVRSGRAVRAMLALIDHGAV